MTGNLALKNKLSSHVKANSSYTSELENFNFIFSFTINLADYHQNYFDYAITRNLPTEESVSKLFVEDETT
jgi:hypothetical protein